jgi:hypothetical protein
MPPRLVMPLSSYRQNAPPLMPAQRYRTFAIRSPRDVTVVAACKDAGCVKWAHGWETALDERVPAHAEAAAWIRLQSGRTFTETRDQPGLTVFRFEAFQRCFDDHRTRPERYLVRGGDYRGNPLREQRIHARPADWVEDMAGHLDGLKSAIERG